MTYNATPIYATKKRPANGLLSFASLLPSELDWKRGVRYVPEGCTAPDTFGLCAPSRGTVDRPPAQPLAVFNPFRISAADGCNDQWATDEELRSRASRVQQMAQSAMLAKELLQSSVGNPSLSSTAVDVSGGVAVDWEAGAAALIYNMVNAGYVGDIWIHAPRWLEPSLYASTVGKAEDGTRRAYIGDNHVIFDAGYDGLIPPDALAGADPAVAPTAGWVYASGPVEYAIGDLFDELAVSVEPRQNDRMVLGERPAIIRFDSCQIFAVAVEVC